MIQNTKHLSNPTKLNIEHFDLVLTLRKVILSLLLEDNVLKNLSLWEKLNIIVDLRAKLEL